MVFPELDGPEMAIRRGGWGDILVYYAQVGRLC